MRTTPTTILLLAASPDDRAPLKLAAELRVVKEALAQGAHRDQVVVVDVQDAQLDDLLRLLLKHRPAIVHLSGHGSKDGEILLNSPGGAAQPIDPHALGALFAHFAPTIPCVVLNACRSEAHMDGTWDVARCIAGITACVAFGD